MQFVKLSYGPFLLQKETTPFSFVVTPSILTEIILSRLRLSADFVKEVLLLPNRSEMGSVIVWFLQISPPLKDNSINCPLSNQWVYGEKKPHQILTVRDPNNQVKVIKHLEAPEAKEMLGVFIAPDGNHEQQLKEFERKIEQYASQVKSANLHKYEVWTGLQTIIAMKSFKYALPVITLSEDECDKLMWKLLKRFLPKAGINQYVSRAALYAPVELQGFFGLKNPYLTQGIAHVADITEHLWKKSVTGQFIKMALEYTRLELGVNICIMESNYNKYAHILFMKSWLQSTCEFMTKFEITMADRTGQIEI